MVSDVRSASFGTRLRLQGGKHQQKFDSMQQMQDKGLSHSKNYDSFHCELPEGDTF